MPKSGEADEGRELWPLDTNLMKEISRRVKGLRDWSLGFTVVVGIRVSGLRFQV